MGALSPTSVIETTLFSSIPWIEETGGIVASAGDGKVAHVALHDVAMAGAVVLTDGFEFAQITSSPGQNCCRWATCAGSSRGSPGGRFPTWTCPTRSSSGCSCTRPGMTPEEAELGVICHFRAWRNGEAEALTDTSSAR